MNEVQVEPESLSDRIVLGSVGLAGFLITTSSLDWTSVTWGCAGAALIAALGALTRRGHELGVAWAIPVAALMATLISRRGPGADASPWALGAWVAFAWILGGPTRAEVPPATNPEIAHAIRPLLAGFRLRSRDTGLGTIGGKPWDPRATRIPRSEQFSLVLIAGTVVLFAGLLPAGASAVDEVLFWTVLFALGIPILLVAGYWLSARLLGARTFRRQLRHGVWSVCLTLALLWLAWRWAPLSLSALR